MPRIPDDIMGPGPRASLRVVPVTPNESGTGAFGRSLQQVGQRLMEREDRFNYARAQSDFLKRQNEVLEGLTDDDYQTYEARYQDGINQALAQSQGMILSRSDRTSFEIDMQRQSLAGLQRVRDRAKGKEIDFARARLDETLESNKHQALVSDDATRSSLIQAGVEAIEGARERNYLSAEQSTNLRQGWLQDVAKSSLEAMEPAERLAKVDTIGFLHEDTKASIRRQAEREIKAQEREALADAERQRLRYRKVLTKQVEDATAAYLQGKEYESPPTESEFLEAYEDGSERYEEFRAIQELGSDISVLATATPEERNTLLTSKEPEVGPGFAGDSNRFNILLKSAQALEKAKQSDPVAYIAKYFGAIEDPQELLAEQERLGVEQPRLLTATQAKALASDFYRSAEEDSGITAASQVEALKAEYGDHWPVVFAQLSEAGMPDEALVIGSGVESDVAETLSRIAPVKTEELKAGLQKNAATDVNETLVDIMQPLQKTLALQGGQRTFAAFYSQAERLAYNYMAQGMNHEKAANRAYSEIAGRKYAFEDTYRIPLVSESGRPYDAIRIADGASKAKESITPDMVAGTIAGVSEEFVLERKKETLANSYWVTDGKEEGLVLHYKNGAVIGTNGEIRVSFDDLEDQGSRFWEDLKSFAERVSPGAVLSPLKPLPTTLVDPIDLAKRVADKVTE